MVFKLIYFFFQAEDGIRDYKVTGVQTCALPIYKTMTVNVTPTAKTCTIPGSINIQALGVDPQYTFTITGPGGVNIRSEERRVGKECRYRGALEYSKKKET